MSLTVNLDQATLEALQADAHIRKTSCEEIVGELLRTHYASPICLSPEEEASFMAQVEEGREAIRRGDFCTNEEMMNILKEQRSRILSQIAGK